MVGPQPVLQTTYAGHDNESKAGLGDTEKARNSSGWYEPTSVAEALHKHDQANHDVRNEGGIERKGG